MVLKNLIFLLISLLSYSYVASQDLTYDAGNSDKSTTVRAVVEMGFLNVMSHKVQFSNRGTYFDYRADGGQDVLFSVKRFSVELDLGPKHTFVFLYQPLRLESQVLLTEDLIVDDVTFPASTGVNLLYNFPFYRFSYLRELLSNNEKYDFAIGGTLQIRNATISFESIDGSLFRTNRGVGLVPALKLKSRAQLSNMVYAEIEADGIYAPVSYLNGSDNEIVGAILDASFRTGIRVNEPISAFFNLRYLGGGAVGTSEDDKGPGDGYVRNWLHFATVSLGVVYEW